MVATHIDLEGQIAVVTGGGGELGGAIARRLQRSGARISLWDIDRTRLDKVLGDLNERAALGVMADVTDATAVQQAADDTIAAFGRIDILINNAGILGPVGELWRCSLEDWNRVIAVNLTSMFLCCRAVIPGMARQRRGRIVTISSIQGIEGTPLSGPYGATKAAVIALTKTLGKELATCGVIVNCVTPAAFEGPMLDSIDDRRRADLLARIPMGRFGSVSEIAAMVAWLCSPECSYSTGAVFDISGGRASS